MLEANESLENIFESAVKEAEKRKHEYVTIEHILVALLKDKDVGQILHDFKVNVGAIIKDVQDKNLNILNQNKLLNDFIIIVLYKRQLKIDTNNRS